MNIVQSWKDSLSLLHPAKLKPFILIMLNTYIKMWRPLLKTWWWLLIVLGLIGFGTAWIDRLASQELNQIKTQTNSLSTQVQESIDSAEGRREGKVLLEDQESPADSKAKIQAVIFVLLLIFSYWLTVLLFIFIIYQMILIIRPSVESKNKSYLYDWSRYFISTLFAMAFAGLLLSLVIEVSTWLLKVIFLGLKIDYSFEGSWLFSIYKYSLNVFSRLLFVFMVFFFLDGSKRVKSWYKMAVRAISLTAYTFPLLLIASLCILPFEYLNAYLISTVSHTWIGIFWTVGINVLDLILVPFVLIFLSNLYIQYIHEHPELYFNEPKE